MIQNINNLKNLIVRDCIEFLILINGFYPTISYPYYMVNSFPDFNSLVMTIIINSKSMFFIDIVLGFFIKEMDDEGNSKFDTLRTISSNYFKNGLVIEFLTFLPLRYFFQPNRLSLRQSSIEKFNTILVHAGFLKFFWFCFFRKTILVQNM